MIVVSGSASLREQRFQYALCKTQTSAGSGVGYGRNFVVLAYRRTGNWFFKMGDGCPASVAVPAWGVVCKDDQRAFPIGFAAITFD